MNTIHKQFISYGSSPVDLSDKILKGRPYGGLPVMVRRKITQYCKVIDNSDPSFICMQICTDNFNITVVNWYLPYYSGEDSLEIYLNLLAKIHSVVVENDSNVTYIVGDFNAHVDSKMFEELESFCKNNNYIISDVKHLGKFSGIYKYVSDAYGSCR